MRDLGKTERPYLLLLSFFSILISLPIVIFFGNIFGPKEDFLGYGSLSIVFLVLIILLSIGLILGVGSIYRNEL